MGTLYENIIHLCELRGIKGGKMCVDLGISKSLLSDLKAGRKKSIHMDTAEKIANYLDVPVGALLNETSASQVGKLAGYDLMLRFDQLPSTERFQIENLIDLAAQHPDRAPAILEDAVLAFGDTNWTSENEKSPGLSTEAWQMASDYEDMDKWGQKAVRNLADNELARVREEDETPDNIVQMRPAVKDVPLLGTSFAAGAGEIDTGNAWTTYTVPESSPADFAIRVNGDSMEPWLPDGSVALCKRENPRDGDVAALLVDGDFVVKQVCQDISGMLHLFSLNRARKNMDRHIPRDDIDRQIICFGTVLLNDVPALPID